jgi:outer membrane protein assembly factor BamB
MGAVRARLVWLIMVLGSTSACRSRVATSSDGAGWPTYGHDPARTFASDGNARGPFRTLWRYVPSAAPARRASYVFHALAQRDAVYVQWASKWKVQTTPNTGMTAIDRLNAEGARVWSLESPDENDAVLGFWPTLSSNTLVMNDDALYFIDAGSGALRKNQGNDYWGQTAADSERVYIVQNHYVDGPGLFVGAYGFDGHPVWQANAFSNGCRGAAADRVGALAVKGSSVYVAAQYSILPGTDFGLQAGFYALDARTGARRWFTAGEPKSALSVGAAVYAVDGESVVAMDADTGARTWRSPLPGVGAQAPVVVSALDRVVVATSKEVVALRASRGDVAWRFPVQGAETPRITSRGEACRAGIVESTSTVSDDGIPHPSATIAAALGTGTLVVTAADAIHVLDIADGRLRWKGQPKGAIGRTGNPVIVGSRLYVTDFAESDGCMGAVLALESAP